MWFIDEYRAGFPISVVTEAAPGPLTGFEHKTAYDRVAMHVAQLLDALPFGPHGEVVEASLPDVSFVKREVPEWIVTRMSRRTKRWAERNCRFLAG